ncbi:hypothetical protein EVAR_35970_1 [Eumeta japonica]|uniref:Uncharacterized protein n=1 Tax=Eumeta variegata TaxID=151549 RepID=A0A4C1W3S2_EUMVA|nr:hypothetical protein EVAR_35970_1 [Eumeta japonica]
MHEVHVGPFVTNGSPQPLSGRRSISGRRCSSVFCIRARGAEAPGLRSDGEPQKPSCSFSLHLSYTYLQKNLKTTAAERVLPAGELSNELANTRLAWESASTLALSPRRRRRRLLAE